MNSANLIVIGGGAAGMSIAAAAKRIRPEWRIVVVETGNWISYAACGIPYFMDGSTKSINDLIILTPKTALDKKGIEVMVRHKVQSIDTKVRKLSVLDIDGNRNFEMGYDKLAIATGATPSVPNIPNTDAEGVFTIRSLSSAINAKQYIERTHPKNAVVVGAGFVGVEMADALATLGMKVTIVEAMPTILGLYDSDMRNTIIDEGKRNGVSFILQESISSIEAQRGKVVAVHTKKRSIPAELVIISTGIAPNVELASSVGLELGAGGAIYVDLQGHTSSPSVFAAGDCAQVRDLVTGRWIWQPLGTVANRQGRAVGYAIAGKMTQFKGIVRAAITKFFNIGISIIGAPKRDIENIGWQVKDVTIRTLSRSHYYPGHKPTFVHLYADAETGRILGGQYVGPWECAKRFDIVAAAVAFRAIAEDIAFLDIPYAPPFGTVWDPINIAASKLSR